VQREAKEAVSVSAQPIPATPSRWCSSKAKRCMDVCVALGMLIIASPLLLMSAVAIRLACGKPVIFRQWRTGRDGREFQLFKLRTMTLQTDKGLGITRQGDSRITAIGKLLRRSKLDELPQLVNVLRGEMSLVGPRPDLKEFWQETTPNARRALALTPGITGRASIAFRNEEDLLAQVAPEKITTFYVERLLPAKAKIDLEYAAGASFLTDCSILLRTLAAALRVGPESASFHQFHEQLSR
jgi:lipopolysaccharide/colanic/teichoic acid biosynthesis glycosyltransferase